VFCIELMNCKFEKNNYEKFNSPIQFDFVSN